MCSLDSSHHQLSNEPTGVTFAYDLDHHMAYQSIIVNAERSKYVLVETSRLLKFIKVWSRSFDGDGAGCFSKTIFHALSNEHIGVTFRMRPSKNLIDQSALVGRWTLYTFHTGPPWRL